MKSYDFFQALKFFKSFLVGRPYKKQAADQIKPIDWLLPTSVLNSAEKCEIHFY